MTGLCDSKLTTIGSDDGFPPSWYQAIIPTNAGILLIVHFITNLIKILTEIHTFDSRKSISKCRLENGAHFVSASVCQFSVT